MRGALQTGRLALVLTLFAFAGTGGVEAQLPDPDEAPVATCLAVTTAVGEDPVCLSDLTEDLVQCLMTANGGDACGQPPCSPVPVMDCVYHLCDGGGAPIIDHCQTCQAEECHPCYLEPFLCYSCTMTACPAVPVCDGVRDQVCDAAVPLVKDALDCVTGGCTITVCPSSPCYPPCSTSLVRCTDEPGVVCRTTNDMHPIGACLVTPTEEEPCIGAAAVHASQTSGAVTCAAVSTMWPGTSCSVTYVWLGAQGTYAYACNRTPALGQCFYAGVGQTILVREQCVGGW